MNYNSDFKYDLKLGQLSEKALNDILNNKKIEVKRDYKAVKTGNFFVEYKSRGKASGILKTQSDYYCIFLKDDLFITISVEDLKSRCKKYLKTKRDVRGGDSNTSKGILLPLIDLIK